MASYGRDQIPLAFLLARDITYAKTSGDARVRLYL